MQTFHLLKKSILFLISSSILCATANAQSWADKLRKAAGIINSTTVAVASADMLFKTVTYTIADFNKNIKVYKEEDKLNRADIPTKQITGLEIKKGETKNIEWRPVAYFDNQLFPSAIISMATYTGPVIDAYMSSIKSSALGFYFKSTKSFIPIKFEIECVDKKFFDKHSGEFVYQGGGQEAYFMPTIPWNYEALAKQNTTTPVNMYFRLINDKGDKVEKLLPLTMRSIDDCLRFYNGKDTRFLYAAYVNEKHPEIDKILREALNTGIVKSWTGYQTKDTLDVELQAAAIWRALHDRGFVYSDIARTTTDEGNVQSQAVRTFDKAIKTNQANCVDGTVVFASILKSIGISPVLILVPGHCFLGYYLNADKTKIQFLETTMLAADGYISKAKTSKEIKIAYLKHFYEAVYSATATFEKHKKANEIRLMVDIEEERKKVKPIPIYE